MRIWLLGDDARRDQTGCRTPNCNCAAGLRPRESTERMCGLHRRLLRLGFRLRLRRAKWLRVFRVTTQRGFPAYYSLCGPVGPTARRVATRLRTDPIEPRA